MLRLEDAEVDREVTKSAARMSRFADDFWMGFRDGRGDEGRYPIVPGTFAKRTVNGAFEATPLGDLYSALDGAITRLETTLDAIQDNTPDIEGIVRRLRQVRFDLQFIVTGVDKKFVYWVERRNRGIFLRASPIDVAGLLQDKLFDAVPTVVLTSATLSSGGNFAFIRDRLGLILPMI
jgi:ATP-dependent DNA helicase DinG